MVLDILEDLDKLGGFASSDVDACTVSKALRMSLTNSDGAHELAVHVKLECLGLLCEEMVGKGVKAAGEVGCLGAWGSFATELSTSIDGEKPHGGTREVASLFVSEGGPMVTDRLNLAQEE